MTETRPSLVAALPRHRWALTGAAIALAIASGVPRARAQEPSERDTSAPPSLEAGPPRDAAGHATADEAVALLASPEWAAPFPRPGSLADLNARDATLTRRLRGYGTGLGGAGALAAVGMVMMARNVCIISCTNAEQARFGAGMAMILTSAFVGAVSLSGLLAAGVRRRRVRHRIRALSLAPVASWTGVDTSVGASVRLTW